MSKTGKVKNKRQKFAKVSEIEYNILDHPSRVTIKTEYFVFCLFVFHLKGRVILGLVS